ncbi:cytochrome P450 [Ephemerocybe angulata]|uniref:Cytochrome P450 n=1 Tax=Ephemerocybe angulata TaxID=980116 RepID=A0A8H6M3X4_9AGAR|nr:cytochrome P450 [Tulosesus angulatus]
MASVLIQVLSVFAGTWFAWSFLKRFVLKDPFAHLQGPPSPSVITGCMEMLFSKEGLGYHDQLVKTYGRLFRVPGLFNSTLIYVYDPKALHHILIKDTHIFEEGSDFLLTNKTVWGKGLVAVVGDDHRRQRKILNPAFSIKHMREMTPTFYGIVHKLRDSITKQVSQGEEKIDILSWMTRTALELIGQSGFGYSFDNLEHDAPEHPYSASIKNYLYVPQSALLPLHVLLVFTHDLAILIRSAVNAPLIMLPRIFLLPYVHNLGSPRFRRAVIDALPWKGLHDVRDIADVMDKTAVEIFESSKRALKDSESDMSQRVGGGKDIMSILLRENINASVEDKLPDEEILAQISTFIFAGMDTTSNALARTIDLLGEHQDIQDKLRKEISEACGSHEGDLDYDTLTQLPFLDAVCRESLRLHPPSPFIMREAIADGVLPVSKPIITKDGREINEVFVPKGTMLFLSLHQCNREPEIWGPDAAEWNPERWMSPLPSTVTDARIPGIYSNMMTFLGGPRSCIGFKFSQLEMKTVLSVLVQRFKFAPSGKKVVWQNNGIMQPTTEDAPLTAMGLRKLHLPVHISLVNPE